MKIKSLKTSILSILFVVAIAACGGGGDDASGAPGELSLTPAEVNFTYDGTDCISDSTFPGVTNVLINGGAGGYTVTSTRPSEIIVSPVTQVNGVYQFSFSIIGSTCYAGEGMTIQVTDVERNFAVVKVTSAASAP